jgi:small GTP-binding protein
MLGTHEGLAFRVVAVGDASVGKTSLINRFLRDTFEIDEPGTIGALYDSFTQQCNGTDVEIQLWDTAGQEQYRSLSPVYFRDADAALIVFDLSNRNSFHNLAEWVALFRHVRPISSIVLIVGNKCDRQDRVIEPDEGKEWAKNHSASYIETSAKTGEGVKILFDRLIALLAPSLLAVAESVEDKRIDLQDSVHSKKRCC